MPDGKIKWSCFSCKILVYAVDLIDLTSILLCHVCSSVIKARRPFAKDPQLDYTVMEDEEWEPEPEGDSLSVSISLDPLSP